MIGDPFDTLTLVDGKGYRERTAKRNDTTFPLSGSLPLRTLTWGAAGRYAGLVASPVSAVLIQIDENPNCAEWAGQVFQPLTAPRVVSHVRCDRDGATVWCAITGIDAEGQPSPAMAGLVQDSGDGSCYLIFGEEWGLRLREEAAPGPWDLQDQSQWGLPFLLLPDNGSDLRFT
jgi:hypothetical protein